MPSRLDFLLGLLLCAFRHRAETAQVFNQSPTPVTENAWGEPTALSVKEIEALWDPVAVGLNTTETKQLAPGARLLPQLFV